MSTDTFNMFLDELETFVNVIRSKQCAKLAVCKTCGLSVPRSGQGVLHWCENPELWLCLFASCVDSFTSFDNESQLKEHHETAHGLDSHVYVCDSAACEGSMKMWSQRANFELHCHIVHPQEHPEQLISTSTRYTWQPNIKTETTHSSKFSRSSRDVSPTSAVATYGWPRLAASHAHNFIDDMVKQPPAEGYERVFFHCVRF